MVHLICYHFKSIGCYLFIKVSKCYNFRVLSFMLPFGVIIYLILSFNVIIFWCYYLMLSFVVIICCYHLFYVIIWCYHFSQFGNVIIFVLSFFLVQDGHYHLCYQLMLSFFVIISPFFLFPEKVTHSIPRPVQPGSSPAPAGLQPVAGTRLEPAGAILG
jgi:hypothetical protein